MRHGIQSPPRPPASITAEIDGKRQPKSEEKDHRGESSISESRWCPKAAASSPSITVTENLLLGAFRPEARAHLKKNLAYASKRFPVLARGEARSVSAGSMSWRRAEQNAGAWRAR